MEWNMANAFKTYKEIDSKLVMELAAPNIEPVDNGLVISDKGNASSSSKPRKKTMTSVYLKYFETSPDGKSRKCKFCGQSYSIATATGNLGRHLTNRHPGYDKSNDTISTSTPQPTVAPKKPQPQAHQKTPLLDYDHLNWLLIRWLIQASIPVSTLDEKWLANSFKFLNPSINLWPREKYQAAIREVFRSMQEDVKTYLDHVLSKISLALEFWTSHEQIFYMGVTCQFIDENWSFQKMLLDVCRISFPSSGVEIYESLARVLKVYNLNCKVLSCTHDSSMNVIQACHSLKQDLDALGSFCYIPCAALTLNMIIDDGLKAVRPVINKTREFVLEINSSKEMCEDFSQTTMAYQEGTWKFPLDSSIRWSGSYQMLDIVCKAGKSMDAMIRKYEDGLVGSKMLLGISEKKAASVMHSFLEPFYKTTSDMCTSKSPTIGLVLFFMDHISETIAAYKDSRQCPDWLKHPLEEMARKSHSYHSQVCNLFTYMTAILDPRIKVELLPEALNAESYLEEARNHFVRYYSSSHFPSISSGYNHNPLEMEDGGCVSFAEEIARKKRRASMSTSIDELTQYLSEPPALLQTDVLDWWKVNSSRYPRLSLMARDFLAVQATAATPEQVFTSKGDEIEKQRLCLEHGSTQTILCIRSWTQAGLRLKYKATEIDYESLMELAIAANNSTPIPDKKQKQAH
uniref:Transposase n=1 Tax=Kalanchoe fedtschenkoi TaxID=63787 RepID=A0A7N0V8W5_KALFE